MSRASHISRSLCEPVLGWYCKIVPDLMVSSNATRKVVSSTLHIAFEIRRRRKISESIFHSAILCACAADFIFVGQQGHNCCHCRNRLLVPLKKRYISILWKVADCHGSPTGVSLDILRAQSVEDLACLFLGQYMIGQAFWHRDNARRKDEQCLEIRPRAEDTEKDQAIVQGIVDRQNEEEGNMNERMCAFRDLVLRHGPWFVNAFFFGSNERDRTDERSKENPNILHWVTCEVKRIRAWESGIAVAEASALSAPQAVQNSPCFNLKTKEVLAEKLGLEGDDVWSDVCRITCSLIESFKKEGVGQRQKEQEKGAVP